MADNTDQLQRLIDTSPNPVTIPGGDWLIDATRGLLLRSGLVLNVIGNLRAEPNANNWSYILRGENVHNVEINLAGQLVGERASHQGTTGEHGMGLCLANCSNVALSGSGSISECWGDAFYIIGCKNITGTGVTLFNNRRNDCSIISVDGLKFRNMEFDSANGTAPMAGIDLEPDTKDEFINNVDIDYCSFANNAGASILFGFGGAPKSNFTNINIGTHNVYKGKPIAGVFKSTAQEMAANATYATCRWVPGYNWWFFPRSITV